MNSFWIPLISLPNKAYFELVSRRKFFGHSFLDEEAPFQVQNWLFSLTQTYGHSSGYCRWLLTRQERTNERTKKIAQETLKLNYFAWALNRKQIAWAQAKIVGAQNESIVFFCCSCGITSNLNWFVLKKKNWPKLELSHFGLLDRIVIGRRGVLNNSKPTLIAGKKAKRDPRLNWIV